MARRWAAERGAILEPPLRLVEPLHRRRASAVDLLEGEVLRREIPGLPPLLRREVAPAARPRTRKRDPRLPLHRRVEPHPGERHGYFLPFFLPRSAAILAPKDWRPPFL